MLNGVYAAVDSKRAALLLALDISAAFDFLFNFSAFYFSVEKDIRSFVSFLFSVLKWP